MFSYAKRFHFLMPVKGLVLMNCTLFLMTRLINVGRESSVGVATGYGLDVPGIESQCGRDFPHLSRPGLRAHPPSCTMDTGSFHGEKSGRGVTLTPDPLLVSWSRKSRAIPPLPLWTVRPVQSLSACTGVHFTPLLYLINEHVKVHYLQ